MRRRASWLVLTAFLALFLAPLVAAAAPRSGSSFSGRGGFRSGSGSFSRSPARSPRVGGGTNVVVVPGFGWGFSPFGGFGGGGGFGLFGGVLMLGVLGLGAVMVMRAVRRARDGGAGGGGGFGLFGGGREQGYDDEDDGVEVAPGRAFIYKVQLGLGRSARGLQQRLEKFAAEGDTSSEAGLSQLLQQTALELMREKDVIRYASASADGPMSMTNGETKLNALALAERSRFEVERVRGADGRVRRSEAAAVTSNDVLEYLLVTVLVATRAPLPSLKAVTDREQLDAALADLGGVPPNALLGLDVIWTPADTDDSLTEAELLLNYPHLRGI